MCGVIGYSGHASTAALEALRTVLLESSIRGRHASGLAWHDGSGLQRVAQDGPMEALLADVDLWDMVQPNGRVVMIGHARYSTSDLLFHQPLVAQGYALAHNGVISQADPSEWPARFGLHCEGRNDSELLLRALIAGLDPSETFPRASVAAVWIDPSGALKWTRNGLRPLWSAQLGGGRTIASTANILQRAGLEPYPVESWGPLDLQTTPWEMK